MPGASLLLFIIAWFGFIRMPLTPGLRSATQLKPGDHTLITGAGPAGLTAAYLLSKAGYRATVLEADSIVGGISRTATYKGFRFDIGGHRFFTQYPAVESLWHEILGEEFLRVPRMSRIRYKGKYFDYPLRALNALFGLGLINSVWIMLSWLRARWWPSKVEENFEQWVTNRFGRRLYQIFFKTYTEKVWGIPCTEIRAEWAAQRIKGLSLARAILHASTLTKRPASIKSLIDSFQYPRLGPGQMWEACRDRVEAMGNRVLLDHRVIAVERRGERVVAVRAASPSGEVRFEADHVISTTDLPALIASLEPAPLVEVSTAAAGLRYRDFVMVALMVDGADLFQDNWIYIHSPGVKVGRIQNFNNWSAAMVPIPDCTCLGMEYFCFRGDAIWEATDQEIIDLAIREIEALGLAKRGQVRDGTVIRVPKAYPVYDAEYRAHLEVIRTFIDPIENLHTVGRNGMHKYNNQDHSMLTAMMTVWNMLGARHDVWAVNTGFDYHEDQRVDHHLSPGPVEQAEEIAAF